jgi:hypothetical protein
VVGIDHLVADVVQARPPLAQSHSFVKKAGTPLCAGHR